MSQQPGADIIFTPDGDRTAVEFCLHRLLAHGGPPLRRLIVVDDKSADSDMALMLDRLADIDPRLQVVRSSQRLGTVERYNRGLIERRGDAVLAYSDCVVGNNWLDELIAVAYSEERTACAAPVSVLFR
jgi:GT2 family glycosyltransferase